MNEPSTPDSDRLARFLLEHAGVRGVRVHLGETWRQIASRDAYPPDVAALLGEAVAASALFTGHAKVEGRLSIQLRGEGALRTLFAECTAAGTLRGIAQIGEGRGEPTGDLTAMGPSAVLAITIENPQTGGREAARYQGLVGLQATSLSAAFEDYFRQSEQLPTRVLLAADGRSAAGLMLQTLPGDGGDDDGWTRAGALFDTLSVDELLHLPDNVLLGRLFHEDAPRIVGTRGLRFGCSCSRARVESMLESLGPVEARAAVIDGVASVRCEFCGQAYAFGPDEIDALFTPGKRPMAAPDRVQ